MGCKYLGGKKTPVQKGKGKKRKDAPLQTLPRGTRRAETTGTNLPSKADCLLIYTSSSKTGIIHYHLQLKCIHLIKCTKVLEGYGIFIHPSHHSPFTVPVPGQHIVGPFHELLPSNHPQLPFCPSTTVLL